MLDEKRKEKVEKIRRESSDHLTSLYDIYEAGMKEGAAQGPMQVTLEEAAEIRRPYLIYNDGPTLTHDEQRAINTVLASRSPPQPAAAPKIPAGTFEILDESSPGVFRPEPVMVAETPAAAPCEYCGPVCYGGGAHKARVEDSAKKAAPVRDSELVKIVHPTTREMYDRALAGCNRREWDNVVFYLHAITPEIIEAAARVGYWRQEDVEEAIGELERSGYDGKTVRELLRLLPARLTTAPKPIERVTVVGSRVFFDGNLTAQFVFTAEAENYAALRRKTLAAKQKEQP